MRFIKVLLIAAVSALLFAGVAQADDTDIYITPHSSSGSEPLVMFSLDYRSNLGSTVSCNAICQQAFIDHGIPASDLPSSFTFFDILRLSLKAVLLNTSGFKIGLMLNHDNSCKGSTTSGPSAGHCSNGGYIALGFEDLNDTSLDDFMAKLDSMPTPQGNVSHSYQGKELFFELFRYLTGQAPYNDYDGWTDYGTTSADNLPTDNPGASWDTSIIDTNGNYISPLDSTSTCAKIFTVNFMFQVSNQEDDSDSAITDTTNNGGMGGINLSGNNNSFDTVISYLNSADLANGSYGTVPNLDGIQSVTSYFIIDPSHINTTTNGYAVAGNTDHALELSSDPTKLIDTINSVIKQILSVSTTFVAASVPVNVFNRAEVVDNVYIALFEAESTPAWPGNLKKLKLGTVTLADGSTTLQLQDANGNAAVGGDGRINYDALTFWTNSAALPAPDTSKNEVAGADGRSVARGAAGQMIPGYLPSATQTSAPPPYGDPSSTRTVYYYTGSGTSLTQLTPSLSTDTTLQSDFGVSTSTDLATLIDYALGNDVNGADPTQARSWILGDALHSRPLPVNYGAANGFSATNPEIYIAMGTDDGLMHFFLNTTSSGGQSGQEAWSFMPKEVMPIEKTLADSTSTAAHPYGVDGAPTIYTIDKNQNGTIETPDDSVWLYFGLRRGGRAYYGMDVTDPTSPKMLWKITNSTSGFEELGYTFSQPRAGQVYIDGAATPVVIFAGGYDPNKDSRSGAGSNDSMGRGIFVVNAQTGALIWRAVPSSSNGVTNSRADDTYVDTDLTDSIPSDITAVDTDGDGYLDRIYVGDTGGNVWRVDMPAYNSSQDGTHSTTYRWQIQRVATIGRHDPATHGTQDDRRFFHRPDFVQSRDPSTGTAFDAVLIGTGNRANPLDNGYNTTNKTPDNWFYMIKDYTTTVRTTVLTTTPTPYYQASFADITSDCLQTGTATSCGLDLTDGWKLDLNHGTGEKNLATPLTIAGTIFFTTYLPPGGSSDAATCGPSEGSGLLYAVDLQTGSAVKNYNTADDSANQATDTPNSAADRVETLKSGGIPAEVVSVPPDKVLRPDLTLESTGGDTRWRTFWYQVQSGG